MFGAQRPGPQGLPRLQRTQQCGHETPLLPVRPQAPVQKDFSALGGGDTSVLLAPVLGKHGQQKPCMQSRDTGPAKHWDVERMQGFHLEGLFLWGRQASARLPPQWKPLCYCRLHPIPARVYTKCWAQAVRAEGGAFRGQSSDPRRVSRKLHLLAYAQQRASKQMLLSTAFVPHLSASPVLPQGHTL